VGSGKLNFLFITTLNPSFNAVSTTQSPFAYFVKNINCFLSSQFRILVFCRLRSILLFVLYLFGSFMGTWILPNRARTWIQNESAYLSPTNRIIANFNFKSVFFNVRCSMLNIKCLCRGKHVEEPSDGVLCSNNYALNHKFYSSGI